MLVLKSAADPSAELCDRSHVSRQTIHFIFHFLEVILHLSYGVWQKERKKEGYFSYPGLHNLMSAHVRAAVCVCL